MRQRLMEDEQGVPFLIQRIWYIRHIAHLDVILFDGQAISFPVECGLTMDDVGVELLSQVDLTESQYATAIVNLERLILAAW